jgi:hypothetical protein
MILCMVKYPCETSPTGPPLMHRARRRTIDGNRAWASVRPIGLALHHFIGTINDRKRPRRPAVLCAGATCSSPGRDPIAAAPRRSGMGGAICRKNPGWMRPIACHYCPTQLRALRLAPRRVSWPLPPTSRRKGNPAACACSTSFLGFFRKQERPDLRLSCMSLPRFLLQR